MHITNLEKKDQHFEGCHKDTVENTEIIDIGLRYPGYSFYYHPMKRNTVNGQGYDLHDKPADLFFRHAAETVKKAEDPAAARAYIYGVICHFALDSECHPYVEKMIHESGISHSEIEMEVVLLKGRLY